MGLVLLYKINNSQVLKISSIFLLLFVVACLSFRAAVFVAVCVRACVHVVVVVVVVYDEFVCFCII